MARHVIPLDMESAPEIVWDDEAGTVEGDNWFAAGIREGIAAPTPLDLSGDGFIILLQDAAHDPRDFWWLLPAFCWREPLYSRMPKILRDVEPTPAKPLPPPRMVIDGVERELVEGEDFFW